jgi:hypothetical protein
MKIRVLTLLSTSLFASQSARVVPEKKNWRHDRQNGLSGDAKCVRRHEAMMLTSMRATTDSAL